ncbi:MAG: hypothetical protein WCK42_07215, partial [Myxococcaceae bacterium]
KLQQVIRDLHWVSDSIFYLVDRRGSPDKDSELLEKSLQKCERTVEVLGVVRDVAWQSGESREKVLNVILLTADLKNIECLLYSCIKTLSHAYLGKTSQLPNTVDRFRLIREKLNQSWEKIYALENYSDFSKVDLDDSNLTDVHLLEVSIRLAAIQRLLVSSVDKPAYFE